MYGAMHGIWRALLNLPPPSPCISRIFTIIFHVLVTYTDTSWQYGKVAVLILGVTEPCPIENIVFT
jgi:hypothetical protein